MKDGAFGLSTGLFYVPGTFTPTDEVVELAQRRRTIRRHPRVPSARRRVEGARQREGDDRDRRARRPADAGHATRRSSAQANWGKSVDALRLVDEARARGVDVTIDQYPYTASSTSIASALLPAWALEGRPGRHAQRLNDPAVAREDQSRERSRMIRDERGGGDPKNVQFANCGFDPTLDRQDARRRSRSARGLEPTIENAAEADVLDRRAGRLPGHLPRDGRGGSRPHPPPPGHDDRLRRRSADVRPRAIRTRAATARSPACSASTCARSRC